MPSARPASPSPLLVLFAVGLTATLAGCGGSTDDRATTPAKPADAESLAGSPAVADNASLTVKAARPGFDSVVAVSVSTGGETRNGTGTLLAPGLIATDAALVTTNSGAPAAAVTVREGNGDEHPAVVDGTDTLSGLAAVRVRDLTAVPVAKPAKEPAALGAPVVALGYLSSRRATLREGAVVTTGRAARGQGLSEVGLFEATAPLGAQGLGGPLVDRRGQVVGIATRRLSPTVPSSVVALPVASARRIVTALGEGGRVRRPYLGIETVGLTPSRAEELRLTTSSGVLLRSIAPGSPASFSSLHPPTGTTAIGGRSIPTGGDVIVKIEGRRVTEPEDLDAALATMAPGRRITLRVVRGQDALDIKATLGER